MPTIIETIEYLANQFEAAGLFYGHGTDNAWDEAVHLVLTVLNLPLNSNDQIAQQTISDVDYQQIMQLAKQRVKTRKPLAYLLKEAWFAGLSFYVDERVLIPRSPFAEWIECGFEPWANPEQVCHILEIGTGSGCMAITAALAFPHAHVDAVDIDKEALAVAAINIAKHAVEKQVSLVVSDCFDQLAETKDQYDIIMSNPPYVSAEEMADLPAEYNHEPKAALEAAQHGLAVVKKILRQAGAFLKPCGILVVELGNTYLELERQYPDIPFMWLEQQQGGHGIFLLTAKQLQQYQNKW